MPAPPKSPLKTYFSITKREWNGMVVLVVIIAAVLLAPWVYTLVHKDKTIDVKQFNQTIAKLHLASLPDSDDVAGGDTTHLLLNPNHLPAAQWRKLGLNEQQISTLQHYEAQGGSFRNKADLKKIYGITDSDYTRLKPHLNLPDDTLAHHQKPFVILELNTADSAALTLIRGIGPAFARRIVGYRNRLGGFYRKEQLKEVFGIDDEKYEDLKGEFKVDARRIHKIDINTVEFDGLKNNPYLNYKQVNAIIMYRKEHGNYESLAELKNIPILNNGILRKLAPYLVFK